MPKKSNKDICRILLFVVHFVAFQTVDIFHKIIHFVLCGFVLSVMILFIYYYYYAIFMSKSREYTIFVVMTTAFSISLFHVKLVC